jgi:cytochrome c
MNTTQFGPIHALGATRRGLSRRRAGPPVAIGLCVAGLLVGVALTAHAEGDAAAGRKLYQNKCLSCHGDAKTKGTLGPSLAGIIGRQASEAGQGTTSRAMSEADFVWTETALDEYLAAPSSKVHGTIMPIGISRAQDRDDLIAYIKTMR